LLTGLATVNSLTKLKKLLKKYNLEDPKKLGYNIDIRVALNLFTINGLAKLKKLFKKCNLEDPRELG
jgi:hypothetical protein